MNLQRIKALSKKELIRVIREPANLFMVIIFPIVLTLAFGFAFGALGSGGDVQYIVGVVDIDTTDWSTRFQGNITNTGVLIIVQYVDQDSAYTDLQSGEVSAVLIIPEGFGASVEGFKASPDDTSCAPACC